MSSPGRRSRSPSSSSSNEGPARKTQRKERKKYSCEECRRLKLKCDREFPCQNCIKRGCRDICPSGVRPAVRGVRKPGRDKSQGAPSSRELELERLLAQHGIALPSQPPDTDTAMQPSEPAPQAPQDQHMEPRLGTRSAPTPNVSAERTSQSHTSPEAAFIPPELPASALAQAGLNAFVEAEAIIRPESGVPEHSTPTPGEPSGALNPPTNTSFSRSSHTDPDHDVGLPYDDGLSSGTLVISAAGRSKYFGPRAGNEWLKDQEIDEPDENSQPTRPPSAEPQSDSSNDTANLLRKIDKACRSFPFASSSRDRSINSLLKRLPPESQGQALLESYFRYFTWAYDIVSHEKLRRLMGRAYAYARGDYGDALPDSAVLFVHELALIFVVFAMGALHNLELQPDDPMAEEFLAAARACLTKGNFLVYNTIPGVQTLHIMAHVHLETERGRNGDTAWPLWGLAMRMIQAMGVHRDGMRWNLSPEDVEERRCLFWNMQTADILQSNCFSRPCSIQPRYCDVQFPYDPTLARTDGKERGFHTIKYEISQFSAEILEQTLDLTMPPNMDAVMALHHRIVEFERDIPYRLRCRAGLQALPSLYSSNEEAVRNSPEVDRWNLELTFQQHFISLLIAEALVNLHRPFFVRALQSRPEDPVRSEYGASFLVVVERSNVLIQLACAQYAAHPHVMARHWFMWFHAFNSAVTLATVILADPQNELASFCMSQVDQVINVYTSLVLSRTSTRMSQNLRWLMRLRQRAVDSMARMGNGASGGAPPVGPAQSSASTSMEDAELLGWRTRLVERTSKGVRKATTIVSTHSPATTLTTPSPNTRFDQNISTALEQYLGGGPSGEVPLVGQAPETNPTELYSATDQMLHNFWDPTTVLGITGTGDESGPNSLMWWDLEFPITTPASAAPAPGGHS